MRKFIHAIVILLLAFGAVSGQSDLEIITFDDDDSRSTRNNDPTFLIIKTNPLSMISGRQFIEAEYPLTNFLSVEGGLGLTFGPVVSSVETVYSELYNQLSTPECTSTNFEPAFDVCDQQLYRDFSIRNYNVGGWISTAVKFYYYNDAPNEAYISLNLKYHTDNYDVLQIKTQNTLERETDVYADETVRNFDYTVRLGYQTLFSPLTTDVFLGVGIRSINETRLDTGFDGTTATFVNKFQNQSSAILIAEAGVRIGIELTKPGTSSSKKKKKKKRRRRR